MIGMALMILGCVVFAWMTGSVTNFIVKKSACELRFTDTMEKVQEFMHTRDLPSALRHQIYDYLRVKFPNRRMFDELSILDLIESTALQKEIVLNLFQDVVLSSLFKLCDKKMQTVRKVSVHACIMRKSQAPTRVLRSLHYHHSRISPNPLC
jgi:hypothetical protein